MAKLITLPQNAIVRDIELHLSGNKQVETVCVQQYDSNSVYIRATVYENGSLYTITESDNVEYISTKPNGDGICNSCGRDNEGKIIYEVTANTTAQDGWFDAQFKIHKSTGGTKSTPKFKMSVDRAALLNETVLGVPEFNVLDELITDANEAINTVANIKSNEQYRINNENTRIDNEEDRQVRDAKRPDWVKLTQAQYDALSMEQKMSNTFYEIMDDDGEVITDLEVLVDDLIQAKTAYDESVTAGSNTEVVKARKSNVTNATYNVVGDRLDTFDRQLAQTTNDIVTNYAKKNEVTNVMIPKGNLSYAALPTTGNIIGWYYYCPDGDGTHGAGNYVWNGTTWYFGGTGDEGYNKTNDKIEVLKNDFYVKRKKYTSTGNPIDYSAGIGLDSKIYLLTNGLINPTSNIPIYVPKGAKITRYKCIQNSNGKTKVVLLKKKSYPVTFTVMQVIDSLVNNVEHDLSNINIEEDCYIGVMNETAYSLRFASTALAGATSGYYYSCDYLGAGNDVLMSSYGTSRSYNVELDIALVKENGQLNNCITVDAITGIFRNPVEAINAVKEQNDSSKTNQYDLNISSGTYDIMQLLGGDSFYSTITEGSSSSSGLYLPNYVNLYGVGNVVFKGEIPDSKANLLLSTKISTINLDSNNIIENITFTAKNMRYACHDESNGDLTKTKRTRIIKNCSFIHNGNLSGLWSSPLGYANGFDEGDYFEFFNCDFSGFSMHDRKSNALPSLIKITNCRSQNGMKFGSVGSGNKHNVIITNSAIGRGLNSIEETSGSGVGNGFVITGSGNEYVPETYINKIPFFTDECAYRTSSTSTVISKGSAVKLSYGSVAKMTDSDDLSLFYGIAMEDIPAYGTGYGTVKLKGYIPKTVVGIDTMVIGNKISLSGSTVIVGDNRMIGICDGANSGFFKLI